jgi:transcription antitermination factor NusG
LDWGVVTTVPANEAKAAADLDKVGVTTYFPRYESLEPIRGRIVKRRYPLFPGYLFFELVECWRKVFQSERVNYVLGDDGEHPARLPQTVIEELKERSGLDGVIRFDMKKPSRFRHGQKVQLRSGPFMGHSAIIEAILADDRLRVLLDLFGRKTTVLLREAELTVA